MNKFILCAVATILFSACSSRESVEEIYRKWIGKEIKFPSKIAFTQYAEDTVSAPDLSSYKVFMYADSIGCLTCKMGISKWQNWLDHIDSISDKKTTLLMVINTNKIKTISNGLKKFSFERPIIIDRADSFNILNQFPQNDMFRTFLLDSANHIVAIGNPIYSSNIAKLYMEFMGVEAVSESSTYAQNLGTFNWREPQTVSFKIANQSDAVWRIDSITTSCECTTAKCSQHEVLPHDSLKVEVCYAAESASAFMREVYVHTNWQNEPITLTIEGYAIE